MFVVFLRFSDNKAQAGELMAGHNDWIKKGLEDQVFLVVGSLQSGAGGAILAHNTTAEALQLRIDQDPFVVENVVTAEIHEITPGMADERLSFLLA